MELGNRWSKPHVATTALHSLFEIRLSIAQREAVVVLDMAMERGTLHQVALHQVAGTYRVIYNLKRVLVGG